MNGILSPVGPKTVFEISPKLLSRITLAVFALTKTTYLKLSKVFQHVSRCLIYKVHAPPSVFRLRFGLAGAPPPNGELAYTSKFRTACQHFFSLFL